MNEIHPLELNFRRNVLKEKEYWIDPCVDDEIILN
jgi:hypothetical protein